MDTKEKMFEVEVETLSKSILKEGSVNRKAVFKFYFDFKNDLTSREAFLHNRLQ
jgi:hypothetical protein